MFTGLRTATQALQTAQKALEQADKVAAALALLEERHEALQFAHKSLRGKFYATRSEPQDAPENTTREQRRAAALAKAGTLLARPQRLES